MRLKTVDDLLYFNIVAQLLDESDKDMTDDEITNLSAAMYVIERKKAGGEENPTVSVDEVIAELERYHGIGKDGER